MIVELTNAAESDLKAISDCIARDNPIRASSFVREIFRSCLDIADMPEAWPVVPRYEHHDICRRVHGRYLIFYRVGDGRITILHILNGAMDVEMVLFPDG